MKYKIIIILLLVISAFAKNGMKTTKTFELENQDSIDTTDLDTLKNQKLLEPSKELEELDPSNEPEALDSIKSQENLPKEKSPLDSIKPPIKKVDKKPSDYRNPGLAALFSGFCPGGGQLYNGKYIKSTVFIAGEVITLFYALENNTKAQDLWDSRDNLEEDSPEWTAAGEDYADYIDERNLLIWVLAGIHIVNILDAYVDAHLSQFPREMNMDLRNEKSKVLLPKPVFLQKKDGVFFGLKLKF